MLEIFIFGRQESGKLLTFLKRILYPVTALCSKRDTTFEWIDIGNIPEILKGISESPVLNHTNSAATKVFPSPVTSHVSSCSRVSFFHIQQFHYFITVRSTSCKWCIERNAKWAELLFPKREQMKARHTSDWSLILSTGVPLCVLYLTKHIRPHTWES